MSDSKPDAHERWQDAVDKVDSYQEPLPPQKKPHSRQQWRSAIEEKIQQAMDEGRFDNLPGAGKPLNTDDVPGVDPGVHLAHRLLKNNGFAPEWIERDKEIRQALDEARAALSQTWQLYQKGQAPEMAWKQARRQFETTVTELNRKIRDFNLLVPILERQRILLRLEDELDRICQP